MTGRYHWQNRSLTGRAFQASDPKGVRGHGRGRGSRMSFFQWLRDGVRQAVVLGLADAVDDVGTLNRGDDLGPALAHSLRERLAVQRETAAETTVLESKAAPVGATAGRRRLGRSLEQTRDSLRKVA